MDTKLSLLSDNWGGADPGLGRQVPESVYLRLLGNTTLLIDRDYESSDSIQRMDEKSAVPQLMCVEVANYTGQGVGKAW